MTVLTTLLEDTLIKERLEWLWQLVTPSQLVLVAVAQSQGHRVTPETGLPQDTQEAAPSTQPHTTVM